MKKRTVFLIGFLLLIVFTLVLMCTISYTPAGDGKGIYELKKLKIGGVDQWIAIRGRDASNPILLVLHGGPGFSEMALVRYYNNSLERHFTVVNWDQRGAGKSNTNQVTTESLTLEQYIHDAVDVASYLKKRFHQEKIFLLGHSWGTYLGMNVIQKHPELFRAYIGTGQVSNVKEGELVSYRYALGAARKAKNAKAVQELEAIGEPVNGLYRGGNIRTVETERGWLEKLGGSYRASTLAKAYQIMLTAPEYTLPEKIKFFGESRLSPQLERYIHTSNFNELIPKVEVPVYFMLGRYDYQTPSVVAEKYLNCLSAPQKKVIWFEKSGHAPIFEESGKFNQIMVDVVLKENSKP